jgi:hypothetical protein
MKQIWNSLQSYTILMQRPGTTGRYIGSVADLAPNE